MVMTAFVLITNDCNKKTENNIEYLIHSQGIVDFTVSQEQPREFQSDLPETVSQQTAAQRP